MAIVYPLTPPATPGFTQLTFKPRTVVANHESPFSLKIQVYAWPGQAWAFDAQLPRMHDQATIDAWIAFKLSLNGREGTFLMGDRSRPNTLGTAAGAKTVDAGTVALSTTLPIAGGTGSFAVGDYLQVGTNWLHRVIKVNSATSVDVWPRLRTNYAAGTAIVYANPVGEFRMLDNSMEWAIDSLKHGHISFSAVESRP